MVHAALRSVPLLALLLLATCQREHRDFRGNTGMAGAADGALVVSELRPGPREPERTVEIYSENRWAQSEGARLYQWFNCVGCHAAGGGGIGPPLRDDEWIYGSEEENVYASIVQGRPDGMPAFGDRINPSDVWKLVSYVRSMAQLTPADTWSARLDNMAATNPQRER